MAAVQTLLGRPCSLLRGAEGPVRAPRGSTAAQKHELQILAAAVLRYLLLYIAGRWAAVQDAGEMSLIWLSVMLTTVHNSGKPLTTCLHAAGDGQQSSAVAGGQDQGEQGWRPWQLLW